jgi:hypothetical protein
LFAVSNKNNIPHLSLTQTSQRTPYFLLLTQNSLSLLTIYLSLFTIHYLKSISSKLGNIKSFSETITSSGLNRQSILRVASSYRIPFHFSYDTIDRLYTVPMPFHSKQRNRVHSHEEPLIFLIFSTKYHTKGFP